MIRLSRLTDYAVTLLSQMKSESGINLWTASDLAQKSGLPIPTVAKILKTLAKKDLVIAQRGAAGGYKIAKDTAHIPLAEIIEAIDGPIALTDCTEGSTHQACTILNLCPMSNGWNKVNNAVRQALMNVSLAEMSPTSFSFPTEAKNILREGK